MNAQEAVRQQLGFWHGISAQIMGDCGDSLNKGLANASVGSIASIYAHAVFAEDGIINGMFEGKPLLYQTGDWAKKTGVQHPVGSMQNQEWASGLNMDLASFQEYANAVFQQTDSYIGSLSDSDLERKVNGPTGETALGWFLVNILATHFPSHLGEIAALKGVHGQKGLPF